MRRSWEPPAVNCHEGLPTPRLPLLGSNPTGNNRIDGAPQSRGPAGERPQAPFKTAALVDARALPPQFELKAPSLPA
jgi:hypothetical protein